MLVASSNIVAIVYPSTLYEIRCRPSLTKPPAPEKPLLVRLYR